MKLIETYHLFGRATAPNLHVSNHTDFTTANSKNAYIRKNSVHSFIDIMQFELNKLFPAKYYNL